MAKSLLLLVFGLLWAVPCWSQEGKGRSLPQPHVKAGVHCFDCHQEEKPTGKAVPEKSCMNCHGDYPAMREWTKNVKPNPHDSHEGEIPCTACHRQHQPPVVKCLECHKGKYTFNIK